MGNAMSIASAAIGEAQRPGVWMRTVESGVVTGNAQLANIFGLDEEDLAAGVLAAELLSKIHDEDIGRVLTAINVSELTNGVYSCSYRICGTGRSVRHVHAYGRCVEAPGDPNRIFGGVLYDITGFLEAGHTIALRDSRLGAVADMCLMAHALAKEERLTSIERLLRSVLEDVGFELARRMS